MGPALRELMKREMRAWPTAGRHGRATGRALRSQGCREARGPPNPEPCGGALGQRPPLHGPQGCQLPSGEPSQGWGHLRAGNSGGQKMVLFQMEPGWKCHPAVTWVWPMDGGHLGQPPTGLHLVSPHAVSSPLVRTRPRFRSPPGSHPHSQGLLPRGNPFSELPSPLNPWPYPMA